MNNKKKKILINILVICLYFIWPYFLNSITNLFNLSEIPYLYVSFGVNFIFLFIIIYVYKDILRKYYSNLKRNFKSIFIGSLKVFLFGLVSYILLNSLLDILNIPVLSNQNSMIVMFEKIPVMFVLNTLFYYPIIEELIFKMSLKEVLKDKWCFVIITGLLNAFFQIVFSMTVWTDLLYLLPYTIFFGSLSYIYYKNDDVLLPIFLRICYNVIPCIIYIIDLMR